MSQIALCSDGRIKLCTDGKIKLQECCDTCVDSTWELTFTDIEIRGHLSEAGSGFHLYYEGWDPNGRWVKCWGDSSVSGSIPTGTGTYSTVAGEKRVTWNTAPGDMVATDVKVEAYPSWPSTTGMTTYYGALSLRVIYLCSTKVFIVQLEVYETTSFGIGGVICERTIASDGDCNDVDGQSIPYDNTGSGARWDCAGFAGTASIALNPYP